VTGHPRALRPWKPRGDRLLAAVVSETDFRPERPLGECESHTRFVHMLLATRSGYKAYSANMGKARRPFKGAVLRMARDWRRFRRTRGRSAGDYPMRWLVKCWGKSEGQEVTDWPESITEWTYPPGPEADAAMAPIVAKQLLEDL
jgi:hypothetical protein